MKFPVLILVLSLLLTACGGSFSPSYDAICKPYGASINDEPFEFTSHLAKFNSENSCCDTSGILFCCFGGSYMCVNGDSGNNCSSCPIR